MVIPALAVFIVAGDHVPIIGVVLFEAAGKLGAAAFKHNGPIDAKVGVTGASTVMLRVVEIAHCPALGVKVYVVVPAVAVLTAGLHVPVIPLLDVVGNTGAIAF